MADTIRVTVSAGDGSGAVSFEMPALSEAQLGFLRDVDADRATRVLDDEFMSLCVHGIILPGPAFESVAITPLGHAVLAHYEERGG